MATAPRDAKVEKLSRELDKLRQRQEAVEKELAIQFQRIADLQGEIDVIRGAWARMKPKRQRRRSA